MVWGLATVVVIVAGGLFQLWRHRKQDEAIQARLDPYRFGGPVVPGPVTAYAAAPEIGDELEALLRVQMEQAHGAPFGQDEHREHLLRWAALRDRIALQEEHDGSVYDVAGEAADRAAQALRSHDHVWEKEAGPHGPRSIQWTQQAGGRGYVRQEYAVWRATTRRTA
ncbi:hypothetical protein ACIRPK_34105 [Kitasatospora sp. NPDC101801]|uniref:hypothetical protein n=1 Tax=Bacillati TaxID=1783272 RepID=UPI00382F6282